MKNCFAMIERNLPFVLILLILIVVGSSGCGPTKKQYAINEALLMDQTRLLENEIYKTRFALQQTLRENEILRNELADLKEPDDKSEKKNESAKIKTARRTSNVLPMNPSIAQNNVEELPQEVLMPHRKQVPARNAGTDSMPSVPNSGKAPALTIPSASNSPIANPVYRQDGTPAIINPTGYSSAPRLPAVQPPAWGPIEQ